LCPAAQWVKNVKTGQTHPLYFIFSAKFDSVGLCQALTLFIKAIFGPPHLTTHAKSTAVHYQTPCCPGASHSFIHDWTRTSIVVAENMLEMISN
jgi:hypothetical protein